MSGATIKYDLYLRQVIGHLMRRWRDHEIGLVASGIFDPGHPPVITTSEQCGPSKWFHTERNTLSEFTSRYGRPSAKAVLVVTLSPCIRPRSESRVGPPCVQLLLETGLGRVHAGIIDPLHAPDGIADYHALGIDLTVSNDEWCRVVCQRLLGIFKDYGDRVNYDLVTIKENIGQRLFNLSKLPSELV